MVYKRWRHGYCKGLVLYIAALLISLSFQIGLDSYLDWGSLKPEGYSPRCPANIYTHMYTYTITLISQGSLLIVGGVTFFFFTGLPGGEPLSSHCNCCVNITLCFQATSTPAHQHTSTPTHPMMMTIFCIVDIFSNPAGH